MSGGTLQILIAMVVYMLAVIGIGLFFAKRANQSSENYFLGGRTLGPWIAAMSAEASDMSGWLLMGLPGVAYWCGLADAAWTAIGLAVAAMTGGGEAGERPRFLTSAGSISTARTPSSRSWIR